MQVRMFAIFSILVFMILAPAKADVVGGDEVTERDPIRKSTAALYEPSADGRGGALCTASIIGKDTALTAAHCIQAGGPKPVLLFGRDIHSPGTVKRQVTAVRVNPRYEKHQGKGMDEGDIALVKFHGGLPDGYQTVGTAVSDSELKKGGVATLAGYGISDARARSGAGVLRKANVMIAHPRSGKPEMILDQSHGRGACHGDSGGPAYIREGGKMVVAGVTNRSYPARAADDCAHQVVYTKVPAYRSWIAKTEKEFESTPDTAGDLSAKVKGRRIRLSKNGSRFKAKPVSRARRRVFSTHHRAARKAHPVERLRRKKLAFTANSRHFK